jgi:polyvinyl alcohol dehydrogenase (cytochrome)
VHWGSLGNDPTGAYNNKRETKLNVNNVRDLKIAWTSRQYGNVNGAAAVVGNTVYVQSNTGTYAINATTGEQVWRNAAVTGTSSPTYDNGELFVNDSAAVLHSLNAETGAEHWRAKVDPHPQASGFSSPVVHQQYVIVGSASSDEYVNQTDTSTFRGGVVAYNRDTGAQLWRRYTVEPGFTGGAVWSSVAIDPVLGLVYGTNGNNYTGQASNTSDSIFALRLVDGSVAWWTQLAKGDVFTVARPTSPDYDFGASPILFDGGTGLFARKLVGAGQKAGIFWALDRATGAVVWERRVSEGNLLSGGILNNGAHDGQRILVVGNRGTSIGPGSEPANGESPGATGTAVLMALNTANGTIAWERQLPAWTWAPITVANGVGFVAYETALQAFNTQTGAKLFDYKTNGTITSAPIVANGRVHFGSGLTYILGKPDQTLHALSLDGTGTVGPDAGTGDPGTFTAIYNQLIVGRGCNTIFCHGAAAGNLLLSSQAQAYQNMVNVTATGAACGSSGAKRIEPGNPGASLLLEKISSATPRCGTVMPPGGSVTVPADLIEQVRAWIAAGAPNN